MGDQFDWVFDFALQFLESDKFDAAVMDFVDEKCDVFDSDDENKFIYSDIHREFREVVESLITSNLGELGITPTMFYESCEKGRHIRDINRAVFERLLSMEDFATFKRIMVKRNMELQIEALAGYDTNLDQKYATSPHQTTPYKSKRSGGMKIMPTIGSPFTEEEEKCQLEEALAASLRGRDEQKFDVGGRNSNEVQSILQHSLLEMELQRRQEELEAVELEKAIALSLAIEEDRLHALRQEAKSEQADHCASSAGAKADSSEIPSDSKTERVAVHPTSDLSLEHERKHISDSTDEASCKATREQKDEPSSSQPPAKPARPLKAESKNLSTGMGTGMGTGLGGGLKPLKPLPAIGLGSKPLPPIGVGQNLGPSLTEIASMTLELEEKKAEAVQAHKRSQEQLAASRQKEEALRSQVAKSMDPDEAEKRAKAMREQRDRLVAMKKCEREKQVREEEEWRREAQGLLEEEDDEEAKRFFRTQQGGDVKETNDASVDAAALAEERRSSMRKALARRMKLDLLESEEAKIQAHQSQQFEELERKLRIVDQMRQENKQREKVLAQKKRSGKIGGRGRSTGDGQLRDFDEDDM